MAEKPSDKWVTPLCHYHHRTGILAQHKISEERFWFEVHGLNPFAIAARLWIESGGAERELRSERPKRERKIKLRDPSKPRRKISSGRPLQSRGFNKAPHGYAGMKS